MRIIKSLSRVMGYVATGLLLPMMLLTVVDVFMRFAFNSPITGTTEFVMVMMVCLPMAIAWAAVNNRHVSINLVMSRFPPRVQAIVGSITLFLGLGAMVFMTWRGFMTSLFELKFGYYASILMPIPIFPFHWAMILGLFTFCLVLVMLLIQEIQGAIKG